MAELLMNYPSLRGTKQSPEPRHDQGDCHATLAMTGVPPRFVTAQRGELLAMTVIFLIHYRLNVT